MALHDDPVRQALAAARQLDDTDRGFFLDHELSKAFWDNAQRQLQSSVFEELGDAIRLPQGPGGFPEPKSGTAPV